MKLFLYGKIDKRELRDFIFTLIRSNVTINLKEKRRRRNTKGNKKESFH